MRTEQEILERFKDILDLRFTQLECGQGWGDLIWETLEKIEKANDNDPTLKIPIIKEKFGTLRIQMFCATDEIFDIIDEAERKSETICERCGSLDAKTTNNGWVRTLCSTCNKDK